MLPSALILIVSRHYFLLLRVPQSGFYSYNSINHLHIVIINLGDEAPLPQGGVKPTFTERPVIRQSDEGNKIIFECRLVGEPVPDVSWFHNDKALSESSSRHKFSMQLDEKLYHLCRLEITNVDSADAGCYRAVAKNPSGEGQATINLTFEEGKTLVKY